ncbi:uncharacterized protein ARB_04710 [Trichophyton benhamiae CBS 112371]|uniref:Uncharacterized protein n=1 Tax=Arthroderma benhamiae (strain ATCC MYA-4681 / CBS 112371) TaxID=663331 RepID=D4AM20_ARTBC|nr:uncharacterized protein ARB_04710 [Trichophyton benhamiae CBS 112371]EFE35776.1 hypothetical protein ARB_04710 [Trichophyton benhamiae CBS 112371]
MADDSDLFEFNPGGAFIQSSNDGIIEDIFNANEDLFLHEDHTLDIEQEGEPEGGDELAELTPLTTSDTTPLLTRKIEFSSYLPEYPETHEDGFTYVIQFSSRRAIPTKTMNSPFLNTMVFRHKYSCTGVKICEYLASELANYSFTSLSEAELYQYQEMWKRNKTTRGEAQENAIRYYKN